MVWHGMILVMVIVMAMAMVMVMAMAMVMVMVMVMAKAMVMAMVIAIVLYSMLGSFGLCRIGICTSILLHDSWVGRNTGHSQP